MRRNCRIAWECHNVDRAESARLAMEEGATYSNFKINHLFSERTHLVVKAKAVFSGRLGREDRVQLPLL